MENTDIIGEFKEFQKKSRKKYKGLLDKIKKQKRYLSTNEWDSEDLEILGKERSRNRLNVIRNAVRTIVNTYRSTPYKWNFMDNMTGTDSPSLNQAADIFLKNPDNATAAIQALENSVSFGLGVLIMSNDTDVMGNVEPVLYTVNDLTQVYLDPDIHKLNGADAECAAIVELKNKNFVTRTYGIEFSSIDTPLVDIDEEYDRKEYMPLVTYYKRVEEGVAVYRLLGNSMVEEMVLPITYIPIIPVFGETTYEDDDVTYTGIVSQMEGVQKLINYAYSNILVRLATSPKNTWLCDSESIEGNERYFRDSNKTLNPLLIFNKWSADHKRELAPPQRLSNEIPLGDVGEMFSQSLQMVNSIIGIPAIGLETEVEKTATEVLAAEKVFNNNVRTYISNLRTSLQILGLCFAEFISNNRMYGAIKVHCVQGPEEGMLKQEARVILQSMQPLLTEPQDQRKLILAMCNVEKENEYINGFAKMLQPMPTAQEMQDQEIIGMANDEIKKRDMQIAQLSKELEDTKRQIELKGYALEREFTLEGYKHKLELERMILQHKLDGTLTDKDLLEMANEQEKGRMELQREGLKLDGEAMKAQAEEVKAENEIAVSNAKTEQSLAKMNETNAKTTNTILKENV